MFKQLLYISATVTLLFSKEYTAYMAQNHIGEKATVCGTVVSTHYARSSHGEPTFLNLDEPYPNQIFTVVIWGDEREHFEEPEVTYKGKQVCVTGKIKEYRGVAEMILYTPKQIKIRGN